MKKEISQITQAIFNKSSIREVSVEELTGFLSRYPYYAPARYLLAKKQQEDNPGSIHEESITAGLYFNNSLWFQWQMESQETENIEAQVPAAAAKKEAIQMQEQKSVAVEEKSDATGPEPVNEEPLQFQSYHTIDYFASQGIRLQQAELTKDKLGQQLKSFTEWLRSMKKLPSSTEPVPGVEDDNRQQYVIRSAAHSIEEGEVVTEAMAEVWAKQGNHAKAIETYDKLSLQNPAKSAYFAAKIDQLKV